jgi:hypothetical protein
MVSTNDGTERTTRPERDIADRNTRNASLKRFRIIGALCLRNKMGSRRGEGVACKVKREFLDRF